MNYPAAGALRRALQHLGYTNQSLADVLTAFRSDGQATSTATVSRWISGAAPMDPALLLYLRERLAQKALMEARPRLPAPLQIAIGGAKGGSGATTIAAALATTAGEVGYRVALHAYSEGSNNPFCEPRDSKQARRQLQHVTTIEPGEAAPEGGLDLVFTDLPSACFIPRPGATLDKHLAAQLRKQDLLIIPCNLSSSFDMRVAVQAFRTLDELPDCPQWAILHADDQMDLQELPITLKQVQPWIALALPTALVHHGEYPLDCNSFGAYEANVPGLRGTYYQLLGDILARNQVELFERARSIDQIRKLHLEEILELLEPARAPNQ